MPDLLTVTVSDAKVDELFRALTGIKDGVPKAISGAINKTLPTVRTKAIDKIRENVELKKGALLKRLAITRATPQTLRGFIRITRYRKDRIPLVDFKNRASKRSGVTVELYKGRAGQKFRHAFKAKMRSGHTGIFVRSTRPKQGTKLTAGGRAKRLHIDELFGPTLLDLVEKTPDIIRDTLAAAGPILEKNLDSQVSYLMSKQKPAA